MAYKNGFRLFDDEYINEHCTPEEIEESNKTVDLLGKYFNLVQKGYMTHDEAMINIFIDSPEYADELLNDTLTYGDNDEIQHVQEWYDEAKARTLGLVAQA